MLALRATCDVHIYPSLTRVDSCCVYGYGVTMKGVVNSCVRVHVLSAASLPRGRGGHEDSSWFVEAEVGLCILDIFFTCKFIFETQS